MMKMIAVLALVAVVACGADGEERATTSVQPDAGVPATEGPADAGAPTTGPAGNGAGSDLPNVSDYAGTAVVLIESGSGGMVRYEFGTDAGCALVLGQVQVSMGDLTENHFSLTKIDDQTVAVQFTLDGIRWEAWSEVDGYLTTTETTATWVGEISGGATGNEEVLGSVEVFCGTA